MWDKPKEILVDRQSPEYLAIVEKREIYKTFGRDALDFLWLQETLDRLEKKQPYGDYTDKDYADFLKAKEICARISAKHTLAWHSEKATRSQGGEISARTRRVENPQQRTTDFYIWRTQNDGHVRAEHAVNNGKIFSWDDPPPTGHPGEDFGCRCWAEAYEVDGGEGLYEQITQAVTTYTPNSISSWDDYALWQHYLNGNGRDLSLGHIGLLDQVIDYAHTQTQTGGGSIFDRVARKIFVTARKNGAGSFNIPFGKSYNFKDLLFSFGDSTIEGNAEVYVSQKGNFFVISAEIHYNFLDRYTDPLDLYNIIPGVFEVPGGVSYNIADMWTVHLDAVIKKESSNSLYPDNEFGHL